MAVIISHSQAVSSFVLFFQTNSPKQTNIQVTITYDKEKDKIFTHLRISKLLKIVLKWLLITFRVTYSTNCCTSIGFRFRTAHMAHINICLALFSVARFMGYVKFSAWQV